MALGILVVGFMLIAGTFPVGVKLTAMSTERTIGMVASKEAIAKIRLYGIDPTQLPNPPVDDPTMVRFDWRIVDPNTVAAYIDMGLDLSERLKQEAIYPSTITDEPSRYYWSALCRRIETNSREVQVTVFVSRKAGVVNLTKYPGYDTDDGWIASEWPVPVPVRVARTDTTVPFGFTDKITIVDNDARVKYVKEGSVLVDEVTGQLMRALEVDGPDITLLKVGTETPDESDDGLFEFNDSNPLLGLSGPRNVWVVPPAMVSDTGTPPSVGGRYPCVGVYQTVLSF